MPAAPRPGVLLLTVELPDAGSCRAEQARWMDVFESLLAMLSRARLPATIAVPDPIGCRLAAAARHARCGHELALLLDGSWSSAQFSQEFVSRVAAARAAGLTFSTVALGGPAAGVRWDLIARHGAKAVLSADARRASALRVVWQGLAARVGRQSPLEPPQAVRFGIWRFPRHVSLLGERAAERACGTVDRAVGEGGLAVATLCLPMLAANGQNGLRSLEMLVSHAARIRSDGLLRFETVAAAADRLSSLRCGTPACSILKTRAA